MPKRILGKTDIEITPIGQGVMQFAGGHGFMKMDCNHLEENIRDKT